MGKNSKRRRKQANKRLLLENQAKEEEIKLQKQATSAKKSKQISSSSSTSSSFSSSSSSTSSSASNRPSSKKTRSRSSAKDPSTFGPHFRSSRLSHDETESEPHKESSSSLSDIPHESGSSSGRRSVVNDEWQTTQKSWAAISPFFKSYRQCGIWMPFYYDGKCGEHLTACGFNKVVHTNEDFFTRLQDKAFMRTIDLIWDNPPYTGAGFDHSFLFSSRLIPASYVIASDLYIYISILNMYVRSISYYLMYSLWSYTYKHFHVSSFLFFFYVLALKIRIFESLVECGKPFVMLLPSSVLHSKMLQVHIYIFTT